MGRLQMMLSHYLNYTADIWRVLREHEWSELDCWLYFCKCSKGQQKQKKTQNKTKQMNMKRECLRRVRLQKKVAKPNSESLQGMCLIFQVVIYCIQ